MGRRPRRRRPQRLRDLDQCLCVGCSEPAAVGRQKCDACLAIAREYKRQHYAQQKASGRCVECSGSRERADRILCERCVKRRKRRVERLIKKGLCRCGFPAMSGLTKCLRCKAREKLYQRRSRQRHKSPEQKRHQRLSAAI